MIILGIDPGTSRAGYGLIKKENSRLSYLQGGILKSSSKESSSILAEISSDLEKIIAAFRPDLAAVEKLYFLKNKKTGLAVAEARGALLLTLKKNNIPILEFSPTEIKSGLTGNGQADKKEVQKFVELILKQKINELDDTLDALAIALLAANSQIS